MNRFATFVRNNKRVIAALMFGLAFSVVFAYAIPPTTQYNPAETLDPNCAPGTPNCSVNVVGSNLFDSNRPTTRAGVPSVTVGGTTVQEFLEGYFFPAVAPLAALTGGGTREIGASTAVTLGFTATRNTNAISGISITSTSGGASITPSGGDTTITDGVSISATGNTQTGSRTAATGVNTSATYTLTVTDGTNSSTATTTVNYLNRLYYGLSANTTLTDPQVIALASQPLSSNRTSACTLGTPCAFAPSSQYIYFAWPASFEPSGNCAAVVSGTPVGTTNCFFQGATPITDFEVTTRTFVNASGYSSTYKIYRSRNRLTGSISYSVL